MRDRILPDPRKTDPEFRPRSEWILLCHNLAEKNGEAPSTFSSFFFKTPFSGICSPNSIPQKGHLEIHLLHG
ncbi:hypothetical protein DLM75_08045 [Leptospira stimsonii]|uniref:Uncharacterized protein n=1 Tax=Leptospira stimsonii TaxID=2202203 RepID=A0A396ZH39_9LEPT|nr:hypothetical protein DLM75_08045 [Leptospira stimsonii]